MKFSSSSTCLLGLAFFVSTVHRVAAAPNPKAACLHARGVDVGKHGWHPDCGYADPRSRGSPHKGSPSNTAPWRNDQNAWSTSSTSPIPSPTPSASANSTSGAIPTVTITRTISTTTVSISNSAPPVRRMQTPSSAKFNPLIDVVSHEPWRLPRNSTGRSTPTVQPIINSSRTNSGQPREPTCFQDCSTKSASVTPGSWAVPSPPHKSWNPHKPWYPHKSSRQGEHWSGLSTSTPQPTTNSSSAGASQDSESAWYHNRTTSTGAISSGAWYPPSPSTI